MTTGTNGQDEGSSWIVFRGNRRPRIAAIPEPPPWRDFRKNRDRRGVRPETRPIEPETDRRGRTFQVRPAEREIINAAIHLRRPLLVTGDPGSGKSSLAYALAYELGLGKVLRWSINSRSTLSEGLYHYDAIARLRDVNLRERSTRRDGANGEVDAPPAGPAGGVEDIGRYLRLGPLGTALLPRDRPRVLLIDEIDKSDVDLPNDLLHVFEEGAYEIPELMRLAEEQSEVPVQPFDGRGPAERVTIIDGRVRCLEFPIVVLTSNGERDLPPAFLRRCLRLDIPAADEEHLTAIVRSQLHRINKATREEMIGKYLEKSKSGVLAIDQLLNALFMVSDGKIPEGKERERVLEILLRELELR
jgi:MoxR-like ATPase